MKLYYFLPFFALLAISLSIDAFAQSSYDVNIPTGSASPDAPYFWQSEKDGTTSGIIEILKGDEVVWKNADTAAHTVTSGTAENGPDEIFDSGMFGPGKSFPQTFSEIGHYPYYCLLHPWMIGEIIVTDGYSTIPNVGKNVGDGSTVFDVEYDFNRVLSTATINEDENSITFDMVGITNSDDNDLEIILPSALIAGPFVVFVGDEMVEFEQIGDDDLSILIIPVDAYSETITIVGTSVVPEFGTMVMVIMVISITVMIVAHNRFKLQV
jgi:predicted secreted protein with PEFG-CTERM motif